MNEKKHKKSFLSSGSGGAFAGFALWMALNKTGIVGESIVWWQGLILMSICIAVGVALQAIDERKIKPDIIIKKNEIPDETEHSEKTGEL